MNQSSHKQPEMASLLLGAGFALASEVRAVYLEFYPQLSPAQREAARSLVVDFRNAVDGVRKLALGF